MKADEIPYVLIVWENGETSQVPWNDITDIRYDGVKAIYKYCPIQISSIISNNTRLAFTVLAMHHQINTIEEE